MKRRLPVRHQHDHLAHAPGKFSVAKLAKAIGANVQSVTAVLKGKSSPNKTTAPKYAKFLGLSAEEFQALTKPAAKAVKAKQGKKSKKSKKAVPVKSAAKPAKVAKVKSVTLAEAAELAADALAVATHRATAEQRKYIAIILRN